MAVAENKERRENAKCECGNMLSDDIMRSMHEANQSRVSSLVSANIMKLIFQAGKSKMHDDK